MAERGGLAAWVARLAALAFSAPFALLVVQAFAEVWRAPSPWPQRVGLRGVTDAFADGRALPALATSLEVAGVATLLAIGLAWPAARVLGERRLRRPAPVLLALALPLLVPPLATGVGLVEWFIRLGLVDSLPGLVLAHLVVVVPYVLLVLSAAFDPRLRALEEMGRASGHGALACLARVTLPTVAPTLAAAAALGALVSWSQYGSSLAIAGGRPTLPVVLIPYVGRDPAVAATLSLLALLPALLALAVVAWVGSTTTSRLAPAQNGDP